MSWATTAHPNSSWVIQAIRNLVTDLEDAGCQARYLIRTGRNFPALMKEILAEAVSILCSPVPGCRG